MKFAGHKMVPNRVKSNGTGIQPDARWLMRCIPEVYHHRAEADVRLVWSRWRLCLTNIAWYQHRKIERGNDVYTPPANRPGQAVRLVIANMPELLYLMFYIVSLR